MRRLGGALVLPLVIAGCAGEPETPQPVRVVVGAQDVEVRPSQYCLDGEGQRYTSAPPILEVSPDTTVSLTVPESVAERGWSVQVWDEGLVEKIGEVEAPDGATEFSEISTSDVVPAAYYLVVVEDKGGDCGEFTGAWPVGFLRAGG